MKKRIQLRKRWFFVLFGGTALVLSARRSFVSTAVALVGGLLFYQGVTGRHLFYQRIYKKEDSFPAATDAAAAHDQSSSQVVQSPPAPTEGEEEYYEQVDEQSIQSFPASDPPATRIG
jgi:hypothetical protein